MKQRRLSRYTHRPQADCHQKESEKRTKKENEMEDRVAGRYRCRSTSSTLCWQKLNRWSRVRERALAPCPRKKSTNPTTVDLLKVIRCK